LKEKLYIIDADYTLGGNNRGIVKLYCKDCDGKSVLLLDENFLPYFYVMPVKGKLEKLKKKIEELDEKKLGAKILKVEVVEKDWQNEKTKILKVTFDNPRKVHNIRDSIKNMKEHEDTFEYDITLARRYIIDKEISPSCWVEVEGEESKDLKGHQVDRLVYVKKINPVNYNSDPKLKVLAFDTEFVEEGKEPKLIMLSLATNSGKKKVITSHKWDCKLGYVECVKSEGEIIKRFMEIVKEEDPDFICGYNSDAFDIPKMRERAAKEKISLKLGRDNVPVHVVQRGRISSARTKGRVHIDLFNFISHVLAPSMKSEILTLDAVAKELLGIGKKDMKYKEMVEIWNKKEQLERLAEYSLWDSELTIKLAEHILPQILALSKLTGALPFDVCRNTYSQLVESFFMKNAFDDNVLIPNRPKTEEIEERKLAPVYKGAIVIEPKKGIHSNVFVFDFRSLYPTIIISHNIDTWTFSFTPCKKKISVPEHKYFFCADKKGFIPKHLEDLVERRRKIKLEMKKLKKDSREYKMLDNEQFALKTISNATYGYFAYFGSKWYRRECGEASAAFGRFYITNVIELAKKAKFEIIYGDTDSLMTRYPSENKKQKLIEIGEKFADEVNKKLPGIIEIEFRNLYESGIFVAREKGEVGAKKRYALVDEKGNLEIRGFETVRRDWCELSKKIQRDVLKIILHDKDSQKAVNLVRGTIKNLREGKVDLEDLVIYEQITRPLSAYEQIGPHVKAAMKLVEKGFPISEGTVVGFVITKGKGSISDRAMPVEFVKKNQYDPDYYIEHQILPASMRVLKALEYTEQSVLTGKIQKGLSGFLKRQ